MPEFFLILIGLTAGVVLGWWLARRRHAPQPDGATAVQREMFERAVPAGGDAPPIYALVASLEGFWEQSAHPRDLLEHAEFGRAVALLVQEAQAGDDILGYACGDNQLLACMALEAIARLGPSARDVSDALLETSRAASNWKRFFALRALAVNSRAPVLERLLREVDRSWGYAPAPQFLKEFIAGRIESGEEARFAGLRDQSPQTRSWIEEFFHEVDAELGTALAEQLASWQTALLDTDFLESIGRIVRPEQIGPWETIEDERLARRVGRLESILAARPPRSLLLVGEDGVGKTAALKALVRRLSSEGWTFFTAGAVEIMAGQTYMGELESRIQGLLRAVQSKERVLWIVPEFHELAQAGRHRFNRTSVLDMLMPALEGGRLRIAAEVAPASFERLVQQNPRVKSAFEIVDFEPLRADETLDLARRWSRARAGDDAEAVPVVGEGVLLEAHQLAQQFLGRSANPGALLRLLNETLDARGSDTARTPALTIADVYHVLGRQTGLPLSILDPHQRMDLGALEELFSARVLGQPEAVDCLIDRVAMIKAGVTDPSRPLGVFLFTGPTGTGKTEIAKTLATYLFGSADRMIRLDMSEFQSPDSEARIVGDADELSDQNSLVHQIRRQPFAVVLLDEFEKAHSRIWDYFLQVFDDGRLTDRRGNVADFRHAIIILTSNLGTESFSGDAIGFGSSQPAAIDADRALNAVFRPEFINRLDRVVVFRPLSRPVMRRILEHELGDVMRRRGLRNRQWAVEWDASALEFLLERGFSAQFGARPLKRTVERYLLAPLAKEIVRHEVPDGDQFLFVRSDGESIHVEFVDPDAPEDEPAAAILDLVETDGLVPADVALRAEGVAAEVSVLQQHLAGLRKSISCEEWKAQKRAALSAFSEPSFWRSPERFRVLDAAEYRDRIEEGLRTAESLLRRLQPDRSPARRGYPRDLVRRLAQQIYLLEHAVAGLERGEPNDAYLLVEATRDTLSDAPRVDAFARRLGRMYRRWAERRRMTLEELEESVDQAPYRLVAAVSGFASYGLLRQDSGHHVFEEEDQRAAQPRRLRVRVVVAPQAPAPPPKDAKHRLSSAFASLERATAGAPLEIVRRYREAPSPLVRDRVRGWRTGHLERVLDGDFDLFRGDAP